MSKKYRLTIFDPIFRLPQNYTEEFCYNKFSEFPYKSVNGHYCYTETEFNRMWRLLKEESFGYKEGLKYV